MLSAKKLLSRLDEIEREVRELRDEVAVGLVAEAIDETEHFLDKCQGWQDRRNPEQIVAEIYATRSSSLRGINLSNGRKAEDR